MTLPDDFISELRKNFTGNIRLDSATRILYSTDASIYQIAPTGVIIPRNQEDIISAVELAAKYRIPVLPRGSGSSLAGQAIGHALIIDFSHHLDGIPGGIDIETQSAVVEPGVILARLNREAAKYGLMYGPDPASAERATMGGVIGNNATGAHSILYGMTADNILSADVILSDGSLASWGPDSGSESIGNKRQAEILAAIGSIRSNYSDTIKNHWPESWRNSAGYRLNYLLPWSATSPRQWYGNKYPPVEPHSSFNLSALLAGSEGTLAIIRSARVRLVRKPKKTLLGVLAFSSIFAACDAVPDLLKHSPSAVELIPKMLIQMARSVPAYASQVGFVQGDPDALLVVEFSGDDVTGLRQKATALRPDVVIAESPVDQAKVWAVRKVGLGLFDSSPAETRPVAFIEDCAIPVEHLGEFVREVDRILANYGTYAAIYAHASAGCLHIRPLLNLKTGSGIRALRSIAEQVLGLTLRLGGAMSSEHGDGLVRSEWLEHTYGEELIETMRLLKNAADPDSILNPGKIIDAPKMDANLRYGQQYRSESWIPNLDFSWQNGLAGAIEQCNGQGICRKQDGVMCPSFQASREEMHSTRGRANLLRALITVGNKSLAEASVKQALDLCLACKGCKAECPSNVDMAKMKYEFQSHYYSHHSRPVRDYIFAYIGDFAKLISRFGGFYNWTTDLPLVRNTLNSLFGISNKRSLPKISGKTSGRKWITSENLTGSALWKLGTEDCFLLPDTFTHFYEPGIEEAAIQVLLACGMRPNVLPVFGAGRTLLSKGFIDPARRHVEKLLDELKSRDPEGKMAVVGLEPSEIYTLRDELLSLLPDRREEIEALAQRSWLLDEYLIRPAVGDTNMRIARLKGEQNTATLPRILLHAHCYQKAQPPHPDGRPIGVQASAELLRGVGYEVQVLDTGCCGMAGAFGYESDHYDLSMQIGELKLFPQIRANIQQKNVTVAATGTSCRSQIADGTGVEANHSVVLVSRLLKAPDDEIHVK